MPLFLIFIIFNNHSHSTIIHSSFTIRRGPPSCILIASSLSKRRTSMGCRAENRTLACLTASRRTTNWATPHPQIKFLIHSWKEMSCSPRPPYAVLDYRLRVGGVLPPNTGRDVIMTSLYIWPGTGRLAVQYGRIWYWTRAGSTFLILNL